MSITEEDKKDKKDYEEFKRTGVCPVCKYAGRNTKDDMTGTPIIIPHEAYARELKVMVCPVVVFAEKVRKGIAEVAEEKEGDENINVPSISIEDEIRAQFRQSAACYEEVGLPGETTEIAETSQTRISGSEKPASKPDSIGKESVAPIIREQLSVTADEKPETDLAKPAIREWGGVIGGKIVETHEVRKQSGNELFLEMEEFYAKDIRIYWKEVMAEYGELINALVIVFDKNLEFALDANSSKVTNERAQKYLSNLENLVKDIGLLGQTFPKLSVKKFIIIREARRHANKLGLKFMDNHMEVLAGMIGYRGMKQLEMYDK